MIEISGLKTYKIGEGRENRVYKIKDRVWKISKSEELGHCDQKWIRSSNLIQLYLSRIITKKFSTNLFYKRINSRK